MFFSSLCFFWVFLWWLFIISWGNAKKSYAYKSFQSRAVSNPTLRNALERTSNRIGDLSTFSAQIIKIIKYQIHCDRFMEIFSRENFLHANVGWCFFQAYKKIIDLENHYWFRQCHKFSKYWKKETSNKLECIVCIFQYCFGLAFSFARDLFGASRFVNDRFPAQASCGVKNGPRSVNIYKRFMSIWFQKIMSVSVASILMIFLYFHFFSSLPYVYNILLFT